MLTKFMPLNSKLCTLPFESETSVHEVNGNNSIFEIFPDKGIPQVEPIKLKSWEGNNQSKGR